MNIRSIFCNTETENEEQERFVNLGLYADMLGLNKDFKFVLSKNKVANDTEFQTVCQEAEKLLKNDLIRLGEGFYKIPAELRGRLTGVIGSMTVIADNDGNLITRFHRRDSEGYWDNATKKYPEKGVTGKWKHEIFFTLDDDEE